MNKLLTLALIEIIRCLQIKSKPQVAVLLSVLIASTGHMLLPELQSFPFVVKNLLIPHSVEHDLCRTLVQKRSYI